MSKKARRRPTWKKFDRKIHRRLLKEAWKRFHKVIQEEIDREILKSIKLTEHEWWSPDGKDIVPNGPVIDFREKLND